MSNPIEPVPPARRILAPDLARGAALLGIAIANGITAWSITTGDPAPGVRVTFIGNIVNGSLWDSVAVFLGAMFAHNRGLPMFATLLGYGVGMILVREQRKGATDQQCRNVLRRRYGTLAALGALHLVFLFYGDIMLTYSLIVLTLIFMRNAKDKTIYITAGVLFALGVIQMSSMVLFMDTQTILSQGYGDGYFVDQLLRGMKIFLTTPFQYLLTITTVGPLVFVGFVAGRRSVLENLQQYHKPMRFAAGLAVAVILVVGIPFGLASIGVVGSEKLWYIINMNAGSLTGPGLVVWLTWLAQWLQNRNLDTTLPVRLLTNLGRMSMTGYVLQSILFILIMVPWGMGIGAGGGAALVSLVAVVVWILTVVFAFLWFMTGKRGPLEIVHRAVGYKRTVTQPLPPAPPQTQQIS